MVESAPLPRDPVIVAAQDQPSSTGSRTARRPCPRTPAHGAHEAATRSLRREPAALVDRGDSAAAASTTTDGPAWRLAASEGSAHHRDEDRMPQAEDHAAIIGRETRLEADAIVYRERAAPDPAGGRRSGPVFSVVTAIEVNRRISTRAVWGKRTEWWLSGHSSHRLRPTRHRHES
jgi:hypothetical protein